MKKKRAEMEMEMEMDFVSDGMGLSCTAAHSFTQSRFHNARES